MKEDVNELLEDVCRFFIQTINSNNKTKSLQETCKMSEKLVIGENGSLSDLTEKNVKNRLIDPNLRQPPQIKANTLRNKLKHLEHFTRFLVSSHNKLPLGAEVRANLQALVLALPIWGKSLVKPCKMADVNRELLNFSDSLNPEDLVTYLNSKYAKSAETRLLEPSNADTQPTNYEFIRCRNHLIIQLSIVNGHRTGVLVHFTIADLEEALGRKRDDGKFIVMIREHKNGFNTWGCFSCY